LPVIAGLSDIVLASPVPVVFDHFGGAQGAAGFQQPGFDKLVQLIRSGKAYVILSAAYRASISGFDYANAAPLALITANPLRDWWDSAWPHREPARVAK
jgi:predicted TIM-barrel fold metal-dependent hydrolase